MTAATYAEGTARFPEAGGSASFARHAFDELVSFTAGWAQMLVYIVTVAVSAFFVPHYLSIFWEPLRTNPWDIVGGAIVIVVLVALNMVGVTEAAKLSITLAVIDFATQLLLVVIGFVLVLNADVLRDNVHWGVAPTWSNLAIAIPVAMLAYTGVETVSNLAEEARDPVRTVPNAYKLVAARGLRDLLHAPGGCSLGAAREADRRGVHDAPRAAARRRAATRTTRFSGSCRTSVSEGHLLDGLEIYVGVLAATILVHRHQRRRDRSVADHVLDGDVPADAGDLPPAAPRFKTPWLSLVIFAGIAPILILLPGDVNFVGTLYSLGATLSFTVAHASLVRIRMADREQRDAAGLHRASATSVLRGVSWPLFAVVGGLATGISFFVIVVQNATTRWVGLGWIVVGLVGFVVYRRWFVHEPLRATVEGAAGARACSGARVPPHPRSDRSRPALGRRARRRLPPGRRARRAGDRTQRRRGAVGARRRRGSARGGATRQPRARRGGRDRRLLRRPRHPAPRAGSERGQGDRRRGGAPRRRDHRARVAAQAT